MDGLTHRGSHLLTDCPALNNNVRRDPHFPCHRQKTDNEGSPRFDAVDADQTSLVIVHNLISHRGSRTNPTGACSHASPCFYRLLQQQQQQPAAPGLVFVRERRGSVPWNSYQLSLSLLFFRAAKTREATPFFIIVISGVVSAVAGNFTYVPDYNRAAIALPTPRSRGCGSFFTCFRGWLLPTKMWAKTTILSRHVSPGIKDAFLETRRKRGRRREVWASIKACCLPTHFHSSQTHGIKHKLLVNRLCERKEKKVGEEKYEHQSKLVVHQHTFIHHKHMESTTSFLWTDSARERKKVGEERYEH